RVAPRSLTKAAMILVAHVRQKGDFMANKLGDLPSLGADEVAPDDLLYVVDVSAGCEGSKKITVADLVSQVAQVLAAAIARTPQEMELLIAAARGEPLAILAYADWLEEQGRDLAAAMVRQKSAHVRRE